MKKTLAFALVFAVGCGSAETVPESDPGTPAPDPANPNAEKKLMLEISINSKKAEIQQADAELAQIESERAQLATQPASQVDRAAPQAPARDCCNRLQRWRGASFKSRLRFSSFEVCVYIRR